MQENGIDNFTPIPSHDEDKSFYSDWGDPREYSIGDIGIGECAGEVVFPTEFELTACEREVFEAQLQLEAGNIEKASKMAYESMLHGAQALLKFRFQIAPENPDKIVEDFRTAYYDTEIFFDPYVKGKFAQDFFQAHENAGVKRDATTAHQPAGTEEASVVHRSVHRSYCAHDRDAREGDRVSPDSRAADQREIFAVAGHASSRRSDPGLPPAGSRTASARRC